MSAEKSAVEAPKITCLSGNLDHGWFRIAGNRLLLDIKAVPCSSKTGFSGIKDGKLRICVAATPEDGRANIELIAFLAKTLGCAKREVVIQLGKRSRIKTISLPLSVQQKLELLQG